MADRVIFNLNGTKFEVGKHSLKKLQESITLSFPEADTTKTTPEYFFERNAESFAAILDYIQHGKLHLPPGACPEVFRRELQAWDIDPRVMSPCCYRKYLTFFSEETILERFKRSTGRNSLFTESSFHLKSPSISFQIWRLLEDPASSKWAKIYFVVSTMVVVLSLFVLAAGTHSDFMRNLDANQWQEVLGTEKYEELKGRLPHWHGKATGASSGAAPLPGGPDIGGLQNDGTPSDSTQNSGSQDDDTLNGGLQGSGSQHGGQGNDTSENGGPPNTGQSNGGISTEEPQTGGGSQPVTTEATIVQSLPLMMSKYRYLTYLEYATILFFSVEFLVRFCFAPNKLHFISCFLNITDAVALLSAYSTLLVLMIMPTQKYTNSISDYIDCLQIIRVFRVFRIVKNVIGFRVLLYSVRYSFREILLLILYLSVGSLLFASAVFFMERQNMRSIPDAAWWAVITMTTVGYGDMSPITFQGKLIGCMCAICGVFLIAVTVPIFVSNFVLFYSYSNVASDMSDAKSEENYAKPEVFEVRRTGSGRKNKIGINDSIVIREVD